MIGERHIVDRSDVERLDHRLRPARCRTARSFRFAAGDLAIRTAEQNVGLDADGAQLLDGMLRRLGLQLARRRDVRHQRQMDEDGGAARQLVAELADRFEERQAFDVADRAADLDQHEIDVLVARQ